MLKGAEEERKIACSIFQFCSCNASNKLDKILVKINQKNQHYVVNGGVRMSSWLDFNGDGKVDMGEQYIGYQIFKDVTSDGPFAGGGVQISRSDMVDFLCSALVLIIVLVPFCVVIAFLMWLSEISNFAVSIILLLLCFAVFGWLIKVNIDQSREKRRDEEYACRAREIVNSEPVTEEEIKEHAKIWAVFNEREWKYVHNKNLNDCRDLVIEDYKEFKVRSLVYKMKAENAALKK